MYSPIHKTTGDVETDSWFLESGDKLIDLKRNSKKELVTATGIRSRVSSVYVPTKKTILKWVGVNSMIFLLVKNVFIWIG